MKAAGEPVGWDALIEQWRLLEFDFQALLHIDLSKVGNTQTFRWFAVRVRGLFQRPESLTAQFFRPDEE